MHHRCTVDYYHVLWWSKASQNLCNMHKMHKFLIKMCKKWWQIFQVGVFADSIELYACLRVPTLSIFLHQGTNRSKSKQFSKAMDLTKFEMTMKKCFFSNSFSFKRFFTQKLTEYVILWTDQNYNSWTWSKVILRDSMALCFF